MYDRFQIKNSSSCTNKVNKFTTKYEKMSHDFIISYSVAILLTLFIPGDEFLI
jgi:hypothetical protein